jgi:oligopeptide/dipeptide ABC transporter ATP-binding protein
MDADQQRELASIDGMPPVLREIPAYCPFMPRCHFAVERCQLENPPLLAVSPGHKVACWINTATGGTRE